MIYSSNIPTFKYIMGDNMTKNTKYLILLIFCTSILYSPVVSAENAVDFTTKAKICERYSEVYDGSTWLDMGVDELEQFSDDFEKDVTNPLSHIIDQSGAILLTKEAGSMIQTVNYWNLAQSLGEMGSLGDSYCEGTTNVRSPAKAFEYMQSKYESGEKPNDDYLIKTKDLLLCYSQNVAETNANTGTKNFIKSMVKSSISFIDSELGINNENSNNNFETKIKTSILFYNSNYQTLKEDILFSTLISQFGNEKVLLTIRPSNDFVSITFSNGKIINHNIGEEIPGITVEAEMDDNTFEEIFGSVDPTSDFSTAWQNGEITIKPISLKMKIINIGLSVVKFFLNLFP